MQQMRRPLANITSHYNIQDLIQQGYAILDTQNLHIKIRKCNSEIMLRRSSYMRQAIPCILLLSNVIYELSHSQRHI
jgi:hypothetical protein